MERWSPEEVVKYLDHSGLDRISLENLQKQQINGSKLKDLYEKGSLTSLWGVNEKNLKAILRDYRPCEPSFCTVDGLIDTLIVEQSVSFKIITKDNTNRIRSAFGQNIGINLDEEDFQVQEVHDHRNGEIEVTIMPLKVGGCKISVTLENVHISKSPINVVVGPIPPPINTLNKSDLDVIWKEVASGNYGKVYKGRCNNLDVAIKEMFGIKKTNIEQKMNEFLAEVNILQRLHHPNIVTFLGACIESTNISEWYIVLEWADKATLQKVLQNEKHLSVEQKFQFALDIARGMGWLHQRNPPIIHFDLKPANILVFKDNTCKITDFGLSVVSDMKDLNTSRGTMLYMPPETLRRKWYLKMKKTPEEIDKLPLVENSQITKIDVYSFGLILWEIFVQEESFLEFNNVEEFCEAVCVNNVRPRTDLDSIPLLLKDIICNTWSKEPKVRPSFKQCVPLLDVCRIESILGSPSEIVFWKLHWPTKYKIPMEEFLKGLLRNPLKQNKDLTMIFSSLIYKLIPKEATTTTTTTAQNNHQDLLYSFFKRLLGVTTSDEVTLSGYRRLIEWFGNLNEGDRMDQFINVLNSGFFYPLYEAKTAVGAIQTSKENGVFLVRLNFGDKKPIIHYPFTISYKLPDGKVTHSRINRTNPTDLCSPLSFFPSKSVFYDNVNLVDLVDTLCRNIPEQFGRPVVEWDPLYTPDLN